MENRGLLFIPDISGFTRLINGTEIEHSKLIIQELLEILINANQIDLEISEIEGDAILFYKFGKPPELDKIYGQVEKMFCEFHKNLLAYAQRRYCQCKACISASELSLKIITHYGEFTGYNVKTFNKLIGKDVIVAHQLLKNDIEKHEYWLITNNLLNGTPQKGFPEWMQWNSGKKITDEGEIPYYYTHLSELKNNLTADPVPIADLSDSIKMFSFSKEYDTDIITLFHAAGDFNYRSQWMEGVKKVEEVNHFLPRVGMKCCCIMKNGEMVIYSSSYSYSSQKIEFSETDETNNRIVYFTLEELAKKRSRLIIDIFIRKNTGSEAIYNKVEKGETEILYNKSLQNLENVVKEINFEITT